MKIAIIGTGHMGRWFIRVLKENHDLAVFDINPMMCEEISGAKILSGFSDLENFNPEMLINSVSLKNTVTAYKEILPFINKDCTLVDIASIKGEIAKYYFENKIKFASLHPMFGPRFTNLKDLQNENTVIIEESDPKAKEFFKLLFNQYKIHIYEYSFEKHDSLMAYSLTLPFASSIVFSACVNTNTVPGTTFTRHRDIANKLLQEDDFLLAEVLFNPFSMKQLEKICSRIEFLKHVIKAKDYEEATKFFNRLRENLK